MTVPLPATGDGSRRQRRRDRRRRVRRSLGQVVAVLAAVAVVAGLGWAVAGLARQDDDPDPAAGDEGAGEATNEPPTLVLLVDVDGALYGVTILAPATATVVHVPPGTLVEVPSLGLASLAEAEGEGSDELVRQSLENLLGVHFGGVERLRPEQLRAVGPLTVTFDEPVEERSDTGRVTVVIPAGEQIIDPSNIEAVLSATGEGSALDRIVRQQAFWTAYLDAGAVSSMDGGSLRQRVLPVEVVAGAGADEELFRVDDDELATFVDRVFPGAAAGTDGERVRVRILNGAGAPGLAQQVQPFLIDVGAEVTLSGNADRFDYPTTQVVYYDDEHLDDARAIVEALSVGEVVKSLVELAVVDVTVVVGADFLAAHPGG